MITTVRLQASVGMEADRIAQKGREAVQWYSKVEAVRNIALSLGRESHLRDTVLPGLRWRVVEGEKPERSVGVETRDYLWNIKWKIGIVDIRIKQHIISLIS